MRSSGRYNLYLITALTALSFCLIGYDNGVIGGLTNTPDWNNTFHTDKDPDMLSTIVSIYEIGCAIGALIAVFVGERIGRKKALTLGSTIMAIGAVLQATPFGRAQMIAARVVSGLGMGIINSTAPVLQAEVSPKASRGLFVCMQLSVLNLGIMVTYWIDYGTTRKYTTSFAWRFPIALQLAIIIPIFVLSLIVLESPRWLANHGRNEEALEVLARLQGLDNKDEAVRERYNEIVDAVEFEKHHAAKGWSALFANDRIGSRKRLLIACSVQFFQQLGGINAIIYYANFLFSNSLGLDANMASLLSGILFTWFFVASFIPWALIDTLGRRPLLIGSVAFMAAIFAAMTGLVRQVDLKAANEHACGIAAVVMAFLYLGAFTTGFQATVWVYPPEILPLKIRAKGTALATFCNWIINFAVVKIFPIAITNIGWRTYIIFAVFNASFVPVMYFLYPETKGMSLEEVDLLFDKEHAKTLHETDVESEPKRETRDVDGMPKQ